jgi:uncharacterized protein YbcI
MDLSREQRAAVAESVMKLERDFYGRGPKSVRVSLSAGPLNVITVLSIDTLTTMDRTLVDRDRVAAVVAHHQAIHEATADEFRREISAIVGRTPTAYLAQVEPSTGYAVRVFIFDDDDGPEA